MSKVVILVSHGFLSQPFISNFDPDIEDVVSVPYCALSIARRIEEDGWKLLLVADGEHCGTGKAIY